MAPPTTKQNPLWEKRYKFNLFEISSMQCVLQTLKRLKARGLMKLTVVASGIANPKVLTEIANYHTFLHYLFQIFPTTASTSVGLGCLPIKMTHTFISEDFMHSLLGCNGCSYSFTSITKQRSTKGCSKESPVLRLNHSFIYGVTAALASHGSQD